MDEMTPREIVAELDKYVVGQAAAKRAVAVALRNRTRRQRLSPDLAEEIMPKNILMIGSTGVGKTEIARRLAKLTKSPFLKVEASKFTEVGYVGRDVESMVRDLVEIAIDQVREEKLEDIEDRAEAAAEEKLLELLMLQGNINAPNLEMRPRPVSPSDLLPPGTVETMPSHIPGHDHLTPESLTPMSEPAHLVVLTKDDGERQRDRDRLRQQFREGRLDDRMVELETRDRTQPTIEVISNGGPDESESNGIKDMLSGMLGSRTRKRPMKVADAFDYLVQEEEGRLLDMEAITRLAIERVEDSGIVFLDEIDKIAGREGGHGPDISREGVQRDILPIVEGTTVNTKYGFVTTDHILFIAAGAFHVSKPSDLIPELQGRFPIRVELKALTVDDFLRILTEPRASIVKQSVALLETEGLALEFTPDALSEMARFAFEVNETTENIGARRLHTIMERVLDEISFQAPDLIKSAKTAAASTEAQPVGPDENKLPPLVARSANGGGPEYTLSVDRAYVQQQVAAIVQNQDLSRYIL
ncbi:MAG: ATP-dependent protease ATPase subunit HslU [Janthinobacterium lividum]